MATVHPSDFEEIKPRYRGVLHLHSSYLALAAGSVLVMMAPSPRAATAAAIYVLSLVAMFGVSALYNVPDWPPRTESRLRSLDHATIFVLIAGTYTPFCMLALGNSTLLVLVWLGAALGALKSVLWLRSPRGLTAFLYLALGWAVVPYLPELGAALGWLGMSLLATGGGLFTAGAIIYAMRWPDPWPTVFGFHEIFHTLVSAACACQFLAVAILVTR